MKQVSNKQQHRNRIKNQIYWQIIREEGEFCSGCSQSGIGLSLSHIIPVSQNKSLEIKRNNCVLDCIHCHNIWEHGTWIEKYRLNDFFRRIFYIRNNDLEYYGRLWITMPEWLCEKIAKNFAKL